MPSPLDESRPLLSLSQLIAYLESLEEPPVPRPSPHAVCMRDQVSVIDDDCEPSLDCRYSPQDFHLLLSKAFR